MFHMATVPPHELDITNYDLYELFALFRMHPDTATAEQLRAAKKIVLHTHPDKSNLPTAYFLFYKKAYDIVAEFVQEHTRITADVTAAASTARADMTETDKGVKRAIGEIPTHEFSKTFNRMFESVAVPSRPKRDNTWFHDETPQFDTNVSSVSAISSAIDRIRAPVTNTALTLAVGAAAITSLRAGDAYYGDEDEDGAYISSDIFSSLKYEDLRKVHKDQTVFAVAEARRDTPAIREKNIAPLSNSASRQILAESEAARRQAMIQKEYHAKLRGIRNAEVQRSALSQLLHLT